MPPPNVRARRMLLLPFRNVTRAPAQDWLTTGAPLMLADALGQYGDLTIVPEERVTAARRRLGLTSDLALDEGQLRRLADETDGWTAVTGNVLATGGRLRISAQALDIPTARVLARGEADAPSDGDVRPAFDKLSVQLLEAVGVRGSAVGVAALTTKSVDAYRAYVEGVQLMQRSAYLNAQKAFSEAVRLDSTFALAWAKLAHASMSANLRDLVDPTNPITRAINRAADNASRLPPRQAQLIRSMQAFFQGQPVRARQIADSLVRSDPDDLDAREWLASAESMDPTLDTTSRPPRLAASVNRSVLLAKEILARDPGRRNVYAIPAMVYGIGGGLWGIALLGVSGEYGSIGAMLMQALNRAEAAFVPVLRDSLIALPAPEFRKLPLEEQKRLRRRSADVGMEWVERWLSAGPEDADAHLWASRFAELRDDYPRALREAMIAESLGVQSASENVRGRRLGLLGLSGDYASAALLADSMLSQGEFATSIVNMFTLNQGRTYAAALFIIGKRWQRLAVLVDSSAMPMFGQTPCLNVVTGFGRVAQRDPGLLRAVMDTVAAHFGAIVAHPSLEGCAGNFAGTLLSDSTTSRRAFAAAKLVMIGDSLHRAGSDALAYRAMRAAWNADTSAAAHRRLLDNEWFMTRSRTLALGSHFAPEGAVVEGDSAAFTFRASSAGPFELSIPKLPSYWSFIIDIPADSQSFRILARHEFRQSDGAKFGGIPEMIAELRMRRVIVDPVNAIGAASVVTARLTSNGFRIVVRGPAVSELKRLSPKTAVFRAEPCLAVDDGLCAQPKVPITYRQ